LILNFLFLWKNGWGWNENNKVGRKIGEIYRAKKYLSKIKVEGSKTLNFSKFRFFSKNIKYGMALYKNRFDENKKKYFY
jgi:hypothetical protein